jgi:hypothetical protein
VDIRRDEGQFCCPTALSPEVRVPTDDQVGFFSGKGRCECKTIDIILFNPAKLIISENNLPSAMHVDLKHVTVSRSEINAILLFFFY